MPEVWDSWGMGWRGHGGEGCSSGTGQSWDTKACLMPAATHLWSCHHLSPRLLRGRCLLVLSTLAQAQSVHPVPMFWVGWDQGCEHNRAHQKTGPLFSGQHGCTWQQQGCRHGGLPALLPAGTHPGTGWQRDQGGGSLGGSGRRGPQGCWCRAGCNCASPGHTRRCLVVRKRVAQGYSTWQGKQHGPGITVWAGLPAAPQPLQRCTSGCAPRAASRDGQGQSCPWPPHTLQLVLGPGAGRTGDTGCAPHA